MPSDRVVDPGSSTWLETTRNDPIASRLIGRDAELAALHELVADRGNRLITIAGPAGVGKTTLALAFAEQLRQRGETDGVIVAWLGPVVTLDEVVLAIATAAALPAGTGGSVADRLSDHGQGVRRVVVLDNCEQLAGEPHPVTALLKLCPDYQFVATSVAPMRLADERLLGLDPLEVPEPWSTPVQLADAAAVRLYRLRAHEANPMFVPSDDDLAAIGELCRRVYGLPLGIELLAVRFGTLSPKSLTTSLDRVADLDQLADVEATGVASDFPERHRSMRAALGWSYGLLDHETARVLRAMSVFAGPASVDMLDVVIHELQSGDPDQPVEVQDAGLTYDRVSYLVDQRLVEPDVSLGDPAFSLVPLIRDFASQRLTTAGERAAATRGYRKAIGLYAAERSVAVERGTDDTSMAELVRAEVDLRLVLQAQVLERDDADALRLGCGASSVVLRRGYDGFVAPALAVLVSRADDSAVDTDLVTEAMVRLAHIRLTTEGPTANEEAQTMLAAAVGRARAAGNTRVLLMGLATTMQMLPVTMNVAAATAAAVEALPLAESVGDPLWISRFSGWVGMVHNQAGRIDAAVPLAERSLDQALVSGDPRSLIISALLITGLPPASAAPLLVRLPSMDELLEMAHRVNEHRYETMLLRVSAAHAVASRQYTLAAKRVVAGIGLTRASPTWENLVTLGGASLCIATARGDYDVAARLSGMIAPYDGQLRAGAPPIWIALYDQALVDCRAAMGDVAFEAAAALDDGWTLGIESIEEIRTYAQSVVAAEAAAGAAAAPTQGQRTGADLLTNREREVLVELATGATNKQISGRLGLTHKTVMHHSTAIYRKLDVRGRAEATAWAFRHNLVD